MEKLLWIISTLLTSLSVGVGYVEPEEKVFTPTSYYTGNSEATDPDWKGIYTNYMGNSAFSGVQASDKTSKRLSSSETVFVPKSASRLAWLWSVNTKDVETVKASNGGTYRDIKLVLDDGSQTKLSLVEALSGDSLSSKNEVSFILPKGTKLLAPGNSYIVASSQNSDGAYPETEVTKGKYIQVIIKKSNVAFRLTMTDMLMWWTDMNKTKPDALAGDDSNNPVYYHTVNFSEADRFDSGAILGVAGNSGQLPDRRKADNAYVTIKVEKSEVKNGIVTDAWFPSSIKELYSTGGE